MPYPAAFDAVARSLSTLGMPVVSADPATGTIHAKSSMSVWSWGEVIWVRLGSSGHDGTQIEVTSSLKLGLYDWGKNKKNVAKVHDAIAAALGQGLVDGGTTPAAWHPDPLGRHELRWWDGQRWSDSVSDQGAVSTDPVNTGMP